MKPQEFFDRFVIDGVLNRGAADAYLHNPANKQEVYNLLIDPEFIQLCVDNKHLFMSEGEGTNDLTDEQWAEIDALLDEAAELEERAQELHAKADALREEYENDR